MDPSPDRVEAAFCRAVSQPSPEAREAFLHEFCGEDDALLARLRELLAAHHEADTFLEKPPMSERVGGPDDPEVAAELARLKPEQAGERIGPYKLLEQIGEGGFGVVWVAEQERPVRRRVALKIIKLGMDTKEVIARFEQERQALAMMEHPNIARVLDAGATQFGRPFFVMELVRGIKITDYCDQAKLPTSERLKLFILVCHAVQHAHQKGIIHRDLKPSNILVTLHDGVPVPKVIDFGVAKATQQQRLTDLTVYTQFEQMIGTPLYMSPEQAEMSGLDIDTRSDIYSLGVLLYELLAGRTPFDPQELLKAGYDEMRRVIREQEPQKPSTFLSTMAADVRTTVARHRHVEGAKLISSIRGDLDWIVMKALEKDRTRRYETANGLGSDIQRHLTDEPVLARPASQLYRFQRMVRRNKVAFAAAASVTAALVVGLTVSVSQSVRAMAAERRTSAVLEDLRATAPAFAEQARALAAKELFDEAIEKLDYALKLRPDAAEYHLAKADLLQCQLRLAEAATTYRTVLALAPSIARAQSNAALCDRLLAANVDPQKLSRESLSELFATMHSEHRSAAELMRVGRLLNEDGKILLAYWQERLKGLPIPPETPLARRLTMREDGLLGLDLSATKITDLRPLEGMPLGVLNCDDCAGLEDLATLRGMPLKELSVRRTHVSDLSPLKSLSALEKLYASATKISSVAVLRGLSLRELAIGGTTVADLSPLQGMPLELLAIEYTPVDDLSPLSGMNLKKLFAAGVPVKDFSPLTSLPLETLSLRDSPFLGDLGFLLGMPVRELTLYGCRQVSNFQVLSRLPSLELLVVPAEFPNLPDRELTALGELRKHPTLRHLDSEPPADATSTKLVRAKDHFWQDWDRLERFLGPLRKAGVACTDLEIFPDGTWNLTLSKAGVSDITCLKGAPISRLILSRMQIGDLNPLGGMPLTFLALDRIDVTDLGPLKGLPLKILIMLNAPSAIDVSVLADNPTLERVLLPPAARNFELLRNRPNVKYISFQWDHQAQLPTLTSAQFWKDQDGRATFLDPLRKGGTKMDVTTLPDGTWKVDMKDQPVSDIACLKGAPISQLFLMNTQVADLSPLEGMPLKMLGIYRTHVTDLRPLRGLPLTLLYFDGCAPGIDVGVLSEIPTLERILLAPNPRNLDALRTLPNLKHISFEFDAGADLPSMPAEQFWKQPIPVDKLIEQGKFVEAEQSLRERIASGRPSDERLDWLKLAAVEIAREDRQSYRATCAEMVKRFKGTNVANQSEVTAKVCLLAADSGIDAAEVSALIDGAREMDNDLENSQWYRQTCGLSAYRAGRWAEAAEHLNKAGTKRSVVKATNSILCAMIYQQQKNREAALTELAGAREKMLAPRTKTNPQDWLVASLLLQEAETLIGGEAPDTRKKLPR